MEKTVEELAAEARKAYHKQWRDKNKDKIRQYNANHWTRRAEQIAAEAAGNNTETTINGNSN